MFWDNLLIDIPRLELSSQTLSIFLSFLCCKVNCVKSMQVIHIRRLLFEYHSHPSGYFCSTMLKNKQFYCTVLKLDNEILCYSLLVFQGDQVSLVCSAQSKSKEGPTKHMLLSAEGFGNRNCFLEVSKTQVSQSMSSMIDGQDESHLSLESCSEYLKYSIS